MTSILPPSASDSDEPETSAPRHEAEYAETPRSSRLPFLLIVLVAALVVLGTIVAVIVSSGVR